MAEIKIDHLFVFTNGFNSLMQLSALAFLARLLGIKQKAYDVHVHFCLLFLSEHYKSVKATSF